MEAALYQLLMYLKGLTEISELLLSEKRFEL